MSIAAGIAAGAAVGSFISDLVGRRKAKKKWENQRGAFTELIQGQTPFLAKGLSEARTSYARSLEMLEDATGVKQRQGVYGYRQNLDKGYGSYGSSNIKTGAGETAIQNIRQNYQVTAAGDALRRDESMLSISDKLLDKERDVASSAFEMDAIAAQYGIKTGFGRGVYEGIRRPGDPELPPLGDRKRSRNASLLYPDFENPYIG